MRGFRISGIAPLSHIHYNRNVHINPTVLIFDSRGKKFTEGKSILETARNDVGRKSDVIGGIILCDKDNYKPGCTWVSTWVFEGEIDDCMDYLQEAVQWTFNTTAIQCMLIKYTTLTPTTPPSMTESLWCCMSEAVQKGTQHFDSLASYPTPTHKLEQNIKRTITDPPTEYTILLLSGAFNPLHKAHLQCLEITRSHLIRMGIPVIAGYICPSSDLYLQRKLGDEAMSLEMRVACCNSVVRHSQWLEVLNWGLANGREISKILAGKLHSKGLISSSGVELKFKVKLVFGADFFVKSKCHLRYPGSTIAISRGNDDTKIIEEDIKSGRTGPEFILIKTTPNHQMDDMSSTAIRLATISEDVDVLKRSLHFDVLKILYPKLVKKPTVVTIGIYGPSGCGKSTLAASLISKLSNPVQYISQDNWLIPSKVKDSNWECPETMDFNGLFESLVTLKKDLQSSDLGCQQFTASYKGSNVSLSTGLSPSDPSTIYLVVEGFLLFYDSRITSLIDKTIIISSDLNTCRSRRFNREGRTGDPKEFKLYNRLVWPYYEKYSSQQIRNAGDTALTISGNVPIAESLSEVLTHVKKL